MTPLDALTRAVVESLTPDLLRPRYRALAGGPTAGHCYHAAEALHHLLGGRAAGWTPQVHRDRADGVTHWWLRHADGRVADPTADQFVSQGLEPPYALGRGCGFMTRRPSRPAQTILSRIECRRS